MLYFPRVRRKVPTRMGKEECVLGSCWFHNSLDVAKARCVSADAKIKRSIARGGGREDILAMPSHVAGFWRVETGCLRLV